MSDRKSISNRLFFGFNFFAAIWILSSLVAKFLTVDTVQPFVNIGFAAASLVVCFFLMFCIAFPDDESSFFRYWYIVAILPVAFCVLSFLNLVAVATPDGGSSFKVSSGLFYIPYSIFLFVYIVASIVKLIADYKKERGIAKSQIFYILLGSSLYAFLALFFSLVLPVITHNQNVYKGGIYSVIIFLVFTAYAIIERGFLKIKVILTDVAVTGIIFILLIQTLLSETLQRGLINGTILIIVAYGGFTIIASVKKEIEQNKHLQRLTRHLEKDKKELIKVDRMKDEFLMMATHELTTPIAVIRGKLSMVIDENMAHLDNEQKDYLKPAYQATNRLNHLSQQLLNVTRIDQDELTINPTPTSLDDLIKDVMTSYEKEASAKGNQLSYVSNYKGEAINIDQGKIKEVISNLIDNAIRFTKNGKIIIESKLDESGKNVVVSVSDTGVEIDEESQKELFGKFHQSKRFDPLSPNEQQGAGLGLYISKNFTEMHGGKIWCESEKGKGSTFCFSLPMS